MVGLYLVKADQYVSIRTAETTSSNGAPTANESFISGGGVFRVHRVEAHTAWIEWRGESDWYTEIDELDNAIRVEER
jgi:hypothetical protein